jgi:glycosyltransferase involved in cell wall biosynthesis
MLPNACVKEAWGWQFRLTRKVGGKKFDRRYLHITPGYLWHLLRFRPDIVISNEMGLRTIVALLYGTVFRKPVWVWWGGTLHTERGIGLPKRLVRKIISRWAKQWISYGRSSTKYLQSLDIDRAKILEIQNAVDERLFTRGPEPPKRHSQRPVLLHVGQFTRRKGIELLLHAASVVQRDGLRFSLVFVGSGTEKSAAEMLAQNLGLKNVYFECSRDPIAMPAIYRSADVLIFPTLEDVWGLVANEAVLCGLPVLCSKYAGCAEELFDSESILDPESPDDFAAKLRAAVSGQLPAPQPSRLCTTAHLLSTLVKALNQSNFEPFVSTAKSQPTSDLETNPNGQ